MALPPGDAIVRGRTAGLGVPYGGECFQGLNSVVKLSRQASGRIIGNKRILEIYKPKAKGAARLAAGAGKRPNNRAENVKYGEPIF